jgi:hypothetical protein
VSVPRRPSCCQVRHQLPVGLPGRREFLLAFVELACQFDDLLFECRDPALESVDIGVGWCADVG